MATVKRVQEPKQRNGEDLNVPQSNSASNAAAAQPRPLGRINIEITMKTLILILSLTTCCLGQNLPPPPAVLNDTLTPVKIAHNPGPVVYLGRFPILLEETTLPQVLEALRIGEISQQGDAGAAIHWLTLTDTISNPPQRIWLVSPDEMSCKEHCIDVVIVQQIDSKSASRSRTFALPAQFHGLSLQSGIRIGSDSKAVFRLFERPASTTDTEVSYCYERRIPHPMVAHNATQDDSNFSNEETAVWAYFSDSKVICLCVAKITSD